MTTTAPNDKVPKVLIAVMGATGTGKSTLIRTLTDNEEVNIGHGLESQTTEVKEFTYFDSGNKCDVTLIDTPGFDDSRGISDTEVLRKIASFLQMNGGKKLNGLIYVHRISDPRMGRISKINLRLFKDLCGNDSLRNVCIATTNWDRLETKEEGDSRELELRESPNLFKPLINEGAQLTRHDNGITSARSIVDFLIPKDPTKLQIQIELDAGLTLEETSGVAGLREEINALKAELAKERAERMKMVEDLKNLKKRLDSDAKDREPRDSERVNRGKVKQDAKNPAQRDNDRERPERLNRDKKKQDAKNPAQVNRGKEKQGAKTQAQRDNDHERVKRFKDKMIKARAEQEERERLEQEKRDNEKQDNGWYNWITAPVRSYFYG